MTPPVTGGSPEARGQSFMYYPRNPRNINLFVRIPDREDRWPGRPEKVLCAKVLCAFSAPYTKKFWGWGWGSKSEPQNSACAPCAVKTCALSGPLNRLNAILSLLHPLDRYRTASAIGSAIGRPLSRPISHPNTVVGVLNRLVLNRLGGLNRAIVVL